MTKPGLILRMLEIVFWVLELQPQSPTAAIEKSDLIAFTSGVPSDRGNSICNNKTENETNNSDVIIRNRFSLFKLNNY